MLKKWVASVALALTTVPVVGCGTVCNLLGKNPEPYGGVERDLTIAGASGGTPVNLGSDARGALVLLGIGAAELTCTVVGDTVTLPVVHAMNRAAAKKEEAFWRDLANTNPDNWYSAGATARAENGLK